MQQLPLLQLAQKLWAERQQWPSSKLGWVERGQQTQQVLLVRMRMRLRTRLESTEREHPLLYLLQYLLLLPVMDSVRC